MHETHNYIPLVDRCFRFIGRTDIPVCPCSNLVGQECPTYKAIKKVKTTGGLTYFVYLFTKLNL